MNGTTKKGGNTGSLKRSNMTLVLQLVRQKGQLSRTELSRMTGLSKGGLTPIIQELITGKVLKETGVINSGSGRKPIVLEVCPDSGHVIAVDFNRYNLQIALVDFDNCMQSYYEYKYSGKETSKEILEKLITLVLFFKEQNKDKHIVAIGVSAPGPLDYVTGEILSPPNFNGWEQLAIKEALQNKTGIMTFIDKDANASAMAEKVLGEGREYNNFIHITLGEGLGAGVVLNDRLYRGVRGFGTELGHVTIDYKGRRCPCGNTGCLEQYASITALLEWIEEQISQDSKKATPRLLETIERSGKIEWEDVLIGLQDDEPLCKEALKRTVDFLSCGLVDLINLFAPQAIIIGGRAALVGAAFLEYLKTAIEDKNLYKNNYQAEILLSSVKEGALLGIANIAFEHVVQESIEKLLK